MTRWAEELDLSEEELAILGTVGRDVLGENAVKPYNDEEVAAYEREFEKATAEGLSFGDAHRRARAAANSLYRTKKQPGPG